MGLLDGYKTKLAGLFNEYSTPVKTWVDDFRQFPHQADLEAVKRFPDQERDNSQQNAYRHALGAGMLAQLLGADSGIPLLSGAAQGIAQGAGYVWEGMGAINNMKDPTDMRHDLNANYHGIDQASKTKGFNELANRLEELANNAKKEQPPLTFSPPKPYLTYTK